MTTFEIAHINQSGVNVVVVFVDPGVAHKTPKEQNEIATSLQLCARNADLAGNIAMIWPGGFWRRTTSTHFFKESRRLLSRASVPHQQKPILRIKYANLCRAEARATRYSSGPPAPSGLPGVRVEPELGLTRVPS